MVLASGSPNANPSLTAGMYEDSGTWMIQVGLPEKSGVSEGIITVAPSRFGIAAFSQK